MNYLYNQRHKFANVFIMPNQIMQIDLSATALAIYFYLRYIEDRKFKKKLKDDFLKKSEQEAK